MTCLNHRCCSNFMGSIYYILASFFIFLGGCGQKSSDKDLPIDFIKVDTTYLEAGNAVYQNAKFRISDQKKKILIQHSTQLYLYDFDVDSLVRAIDLDTLDIVFPQGNLGGALYSDSDSSYTLFFPQKKKVFHLDSDFNQLKELDLSGINEVNHVFLPFGEVFYYNPERRAYFIGMMRGDNGDIVDFLEDTRFIGIFDAESGKLKSQFSGFSDDRKATKLNALSEGLFYVDEYEDGFLVRDVIGTQTIYNWDFEGNLVDKYNIGTGRTAMEIQPYGNEDLFGSKRSDSFYGLKSVDNQLIISNLFLREYLEDTSRIDGLLLIEDIVSGKSFSKEMYAFHKIVHADDSTIWMVRNHPSIEDMILLKINYRLEK